MTKNASLHHVRTTGSVAIFRVDAPAVAGGLTRKANRLGVDMIAGVDMPKGLTERVCKALRCTSGLQFHRNEHGKWFLRAVLLEPINTELTPRVAEPVADTNTQAHGRHSCHRCNGTGRVASSRDNGLCYRCKGKGYTTRIDRRRNATYAAHRKARIEAWRNANRERHEAARAEALAVGRS